MTHFMRKDGNQGHGFDHGGIPQTIIQNEIATIKGDKNGFFGTPLRERPIDFGSVHDGIHFVMMI